MNDPKKILNDFGAQIRAEAEVIAAKNLRLLDGPLRQAAHRDYMRRIYGNDMAAILGGETIPPTGQIQVRKRLTEQEAEAAKARFLATHHADRPRPAPDTSWIQTGSIKGEYDRKPPKITCPMQLAIATVLIGLGIAIGAVIWA